MRLRKIKNLPHRLRRELNKIPLLNAMGEQSYQKSLEYHSQFLPQLDVSEAKVVEALRQEGAYTLNLEQLQLSTTSTMLAKAFSLANNLVDIPQLTLKDSAGCEVGSGKEDLKEFSEILLWALEPKLLNIIENYIGLPIVYQGFAVRRSLADGQYSGVRRWHIDWEDRRIIKIIIYLNDVAAGGGPYEYISRSKTAEAIKTLNYYNLGYISDAEMATAVPQKDWNACLSEMGTMVISDTSSVFHRAQPPTQKERFSITFCYTSATPKVTWKGRKISRQQWDDINVQLSPRQQTCLNKRGYCIT